MGSVGHSGSVGVIDDQIVTVTDLFMSKVRETPDAVFVQYPETPRGRSDYVGYTITDIDRLADEAARQYTKNGLKPESSSDKCEVVALLATSNLDYVISILALSRMGFSLLLLSTRLSTEAYANLLRLTDCRKIIVGKTLVSTAGTIQEQVPVASFGIIRKDEYQLSKPSGPRFPHVRPVNAGQQLCFIIHSSGSTGLPKPILQTHSACLANYSSGIPYRAFMTLPLYHNHGLSVMFRGLLAGNKISIYNANLPLSGSTLVESMRATQPESLHCVPYALKLMAETEGGIDELKRLKMVMFGGSSCPDELGDRLTEAGVYLVGQFGSTETGQLMTSFREPEDKAWNYMRPLPLPKKYMRMIPRGGNTFECMVVDGLPSKSTSNSDDPPGSYYTRDIFTPHPTIPDAWKYLSRLDDRVTLINGEKVLPIPYEHTVRQHELVQEAVVFGVDRAVPGLMVVPSAKTASLPREEVRRALLPTIELANARAEEFGRIAPEMIEMLDAGTEYPRTDKDSVIRAAFYRTFAGQIEDVYRRFEAPQLGAGSTALRALGYEELVQYLLDLFRNNMDKASLEPTTDFFEGGVDSRQAITARAQITRELDVGGKPVGSNVVFEYPSVEQLARYLYALRTGSAEDDGEDGEIAAMAELIEKYSDFEPRKSGPVEIDGETLLLTGTTGSLGAHILAKVLRERAVKHVYCLVRASSPELAKSRVVATFEAKAIPALGTAELSKITFLPSDLSQPSLGLDETMLDELRQSLSVVVHSAWAVNFNIGVRSFEQQHIRGAYHLLNLCLGTRTAAPARFYFCSSISAAAGTPRPAVIRECHVDDLSHAQDMGYARSKLVTEQIVKAAGDKTGMVASVLRIGQIVGDTTSGLWNTTEAIPLMIQGVNTLKALPELDENPSWMPVDLVARTVMELAGVGTTKPAARSAVYNVQNRRLFHWTRHLVPALRQAGLSDFETVPQRAWVRALRASDPDPETNPTIKLVDFFATKYDNDGPGRSGLVFETQAGEKESRTLAEGFDVIGSGLVLRMVRWWQTQW